MTIIASNKIIYSVESCADLRNWSQELRWLRVKVDNGAKSLNFVLSCFYQMQICKRPPRCSDYFIAHLLTFECFQASMLTKNLLSNRRKRIDKLFRIDNLVWLSKNLPNLPGSRNGLDFWWNRPEGLSRIFSLLVLFDFRIQYSASFLFTLFRCQFSRQSCLIPKVDFIFGIRSRVWQLNAIYKPLDLMQRIDQT